MKIKEGLNISTDEFWYDLTDGGYLNPRKICDDPADAKKVLEAIAIILDFQKSCEEQIENFNQDGE
jgi:hypothetical protein